ncbi:RNA polymerase sigma factor [Piscinibacter sakaiensis]|uniref:RNA polymerase sigma factor n=1 Tax=Piscinibacter sakaiensis TaxID=1547922 RepID=UPI0006B5B66E|nr:sigma-70 family RNA polymerase sigma factor [Piscinibacter sakaiensis]
MAEADGDWALWSHARAGDAAAAGALVQRLTPTAHGLALRLLGRPEDAEDAVQEAWARLWRAQPSADRGARLSTYFNTIVINRCRSQLVARREFATEPEALATLQDADGASAAPPAAAAGDTTALAAALRRLPARQRVAVVLWAYADASVDDIARELELAPNAVHQLLHRARAALRRHLEGAEA